jgi:undecaprenyl-diphosphatase
LVALSVAGYAGLLWIALAVAVARCQRLAVLRFAAATGIAVWSADLLSLAIKAAVGRPRPFEAIPEADPLLGGVVGSSFPSGHAATSFAGAVFLAFAMPRVALALFALATAVGYSRVYVGVHYPADVLAGAILGAAVGTAVGVWLRPPRRPGAGPLRRQPAPPPG